MTLHLSWQQLLKRILPSDVTFARYGGEEFLISINNATKEELKEIVENMRKSVEKHTFYY